MTLRDQLFGFDGRIRRTEWWVRNLLTGLVAMAVNVPFRLFLGGEDGPFQGETGVYAYLAVELLLMAPFLWIQTAISVQRSHDLNIPAWPIITFQVFAVGSGYLPFDQLFSATGPVTLDRAILATNLVYGLGCLVELIVLGFLPGTRGPNRFGPPVGFTDKPVFTAPGGVD